MGKQKSKQLPVPWSQEDLAYLAKNMKKPNKELADHLNRTEGAVQFQKARLRKGKGLVHAAAPEAPQAIHHLNGHDRPPVLQVERNGSRYSVYDRELAERILKNIG